MKYQCSSCGFVMQSREGDALTCPKCGFDQKVPTAYEQAMADGAALTYANQHAIIPMWLIVAGYAVIITAAVVLRVRFKAAVGWGHAEGAHIRVLFILGVIGCWALSVGSARFISQRSFKKRTGKSAERHFARYCLTGGTRIELCSPLGALISALLLYAVSCALLGPDSLLMVRTPFVFLVFVWLLTTLWAVIFSALRSMLFFGPTG